MVRLPIVCDYSVLFELTAWWTSASASLEVLAIGVGAFVVMISHALPKSTVFAIWFHTCLDLLIDNGVESSDCFSMEHNLICCLFPYIGIKILDYKEMPNWVCSNHPEYLTSLVLLSHNLFHIRLPMPLGFILGIRLAQVIILSLLSKPSSSVGEVFT